MLLKGGIKGKEKGIYGAFAINRFYLDKFQFTQGYRTKC